VAGCRRGDALGPAAGALAAVPAAGGLVVRADDPAADPAHRHALAALGHREVAVAAARDAAASWVLELHGDARSAPLAPLLPELRLLAQDAVARAGSPAPPF